MAAAQAQIRAPYTTEIAIPILNAWDLWFVEPTIAKRDCSPGNRQAVDTLLLLSIVVLHLRRPSLVYEHSIYF